MLLNPNPKYHKSILSFKFNLGMKCVFWYIEAHSCQPLFSQIRDMSQTYFFELLETISPVSMKLCTQHLWTLLTKSY